MFGDGMHEADGQWDFRASVESELNWDSFNKEIDLTPQSGGLLRDGGVILDGSGAGFPAGSLEGDQDPEAMIQSLVSRPSSVELSENPTGMQMTREEHQNALAIKEMIENSAELDNLSDMYYAQLAIIGEGDTEWALNKAFKLQKYCRDNQLLETYEDGARQVAAFMDIHPGLILGVNHFERDGNQVGIFDITRFNNGAWMDPDKQDNIMKASIYLCHVLFSNLACVRKGAVFLCECEGYSIHKNMISIEGFSKLFNENLYSYPAKLRKIKYFHSPMLLNVMFTIMKKLIPEEIHSKIQVRCGSERRLDAMCMLPSPEVASKRILEDMKEMLRTRYENDRNFVL